MLRFAADENFDGRVLRGLIRAVPTIEVIRVQDSDVAGCSDEELVIWAAAENLVILSHDVTTLTAAFNDRLRGGESLPGLVEVSLRLGIGRAIEDLQLLAELGQRDDCENRILYLPD